MQKECDVIIVGAGPAGSTAAYELALKGVNVIILDKEKFPRYKACGGGITYKAAQLLPFSIDPVVEKIIHEISFSSNYKSQFQRRSDKCFMYCVMRDRFDQFLVEKAIEIGAEFIDSTKVTDVSYNDKSVIVKTSKSEFKGKVLIGADGANSIVARSCGLSKEIIKGVTLEAEIRLNNHSEKLHEAVQIDWGTVPAGYAWIFPKNDHISLGVGGPLEVSKYLKSYYQNILKDHDIPASEVYSLKAHTLPYRLKAGNYSNSNVILTGDAAGLTDALTGEGIYYAIKSGRIAAKVSYEYLSGLSHDIANYDKAVNEEIMNELLAVFPILHIFHAFPERVHNFIRDNDRAWSAFVRILRGEKSYSSFPDALRLYSFLWKPINKTAYLLYRKNMRRFKRRNMM